jgi:hypothetical protein
MSTVYERRVEQEWRMLRALADCNYHLDLTARRCQAGEEIFGFSLSATNATVVDGQRVRLRETHAAILRCPRFFPAVPLEINLNSPVFHPNVHPENGFVCLWDRFSTEDTVIHALLKLQKVLTWNLYNRESDHVMQPKSLEWLDNPDRDLPLPLDCKELRKPAEFEERCLAAERPHRRRLF